MKIVIDIPEEMYEAAKTDMWCGSPTLGYAIKKGTPYEEIPHGEWIVVVPNVSSKCPFCSTIVSDTPNYCENCGASMKKEGDEK